MTIIYVVTCTTHDWDASYSRIVKAFCSHEDVLNFIEKCQKEADELFAYHREFPYEYDSDIHPHKYDNKFLRLGDMGNTYGYVEIELE